MSTTEQHRTDEATAPFSEAVKAASWQVHEHAEHSRFMQDLLAGHVDAYFGNPAEILPQVGGDAIKVLATSGEEREAALPDTPSVDELYEGVSLTTWNGLVFKSGAPEETITRISDAVQKITQDPAYVEAISKIGVKPIGDSAEHFAAFIAESGPRWNAAIDAAGIEQQ